MELPSSELFLLLSKLVPGFIAANIFHSLTPHPKRDLLDRVVTALIFTIITQGLLVLINLAPDRLHASGELSWTLDATDHLILGPILGAALGLLWSHAVNRDWTHWPLRKIGTTKKSSLPSQWFSAFARYPRYVLLHLKCGRRLMGYPLEWPDEPTAGHFLLQEPSWVLLDGAEVPCIEVEVMLVKAQDVQTVEFLRCKQDPVLNTNRQLMEEAHQTLAAIRKETPNGREGPPTEDRDVEGDEQPPSQPPSHT